MRRRILTKAALVVAFTGCVAGAFAFISSLSPSERTKARATFLVSILDIKDGIPKKIQIRDQEIIVLKLTNEQLQDLRSMDEHVYVKSQPGCKLKSKLCVYYSASTRLGYPVTHVEKGKEKPVDKSQIWLGGYIDRMHDSNYDYLGRTIKTQKRTLNSFTAEVDNLESPSYSVKGSTIEIDMLSQ